MLLLADVGNSRMKWGLVRGECIEHMAALPLPTDLEQAQRCWQQRLQAWQVPAGVFWIIASTNPPAADLLQRWLQDRGDSVRRLKSHQELPIQTRVDFPERVGLDRLLNAIAANHRLGQGRPKYIVDAGSAITLDWIDAQGVFCGGAILPGFRLMAEALHRYTARLPLVAPSGEFPALPARHTQAAIQAGILAAVLGAITTLKERYLQVYKSPSAMQGLHTACPDNQDTCTDVHNDTLEPVCFLTGGDSELLIEHLGGSFLHWPEMTLEGLRIVAAQWGESPAAH